MALIQQVRIHHGRFEAAAKKVEKKQAEAAQRFTPERMAAYEAMFADVRPG